MGWLKSAATENLQLRQILVALLVMGGLSSCAPGGAGGETMVDSGSESVVEITATRRSFATPETTPTATGRAFRGPPATATPTLTPPADPYSHRDPVFSPTGCAPGGSCFQGAWLFANVVQWTPDGATIVFSNRASLYAVATDGSRLWQVAEPGTEDGRPDDPIGTMTAFAIASDGVEVIYSTCRYPDPEVAARREAAGQRIEEQDYEYEVARVRIDGTEHQRLTENRVFDNHPAWSPDGRRIAFLAGGYLDNRVMPRLHTMAPDGSDRQVLGTGGVATLIPTPPQWSPDGKHVGYAKNLGKMSHIYTHAIGATKPLRLTDTVSGPSWSPDGQRIAFAKADGAEVAL